MENASLQSKTPIKASRRRSIEPVLSSILHRDETHTRAQRRRVATSSDNAIHSLESHGRRARLRNQLQPVNRARPRRPGIRTAGRYDIARLLTIHDLALRRKVEGRGAVRAEVVVAEREHGGEGFLEVSQRHVDGESGEVVENCLVGFCEVGGVEEGCFCAEGDGGGGCIGAGVVLDAAA